MGETKGEKREEGEKEGKGGPGAGGNERERDSNCHLGEAKRFLSGVWESNRNSISLKCYTKNNRVHPHYEQNVQMERRCPGARPPPTSQSSRHSNPSKLPAVGAHNITMKYISTP